MPRGKTRVVSSPTAPSRSPSLPGSPTKDQVAEEVTTSVPGTDVLHMDHFTSMMIQLSKDLDSKLLVFQDRILNLLEPFVKTDATSAAAPPVAHSPDATSTQPKASVQPMDASSVHSHPVQHLDTTSQPSMGPQQPLDATSTSPWVDSSAVPHNMDATSQTPMGPQPLVDATSTMPQAHYQPERFSSQPSAERSIFTTSQDTPYKRLKPHHLPTFHGSNTDDSVDNFIDQVDAIWDFSQVPESSLIMILPLVLKDHAFKWFASLGPERTQLTTWDAWKTALRNAFRPPNYEEYIHVRCTRRRLEPDESFADYYQDKLELLNKCYGTSLSTRLKVHEILAGFPSWMHPTIKSNANHATTLEDFRRTLLDVEEGLLAQSHVFFYSENEDNDDDDGDHDNTSSGTELTFAEGVIVRNQNPDPSKTPARQPPGLPNRPAQPPRDTGRPVQHPNTGHWHNSPLAQPN